jgi:hypothetical protein
VGEGNWNNLWSIKTVLRSFEIGSGLKVNFFKSKLYGIWVLLHASFTVEWIPYHFGFLEYW